MFENSVLVDKMDLALKTLFRNKGRKTVFTCVYQGNIVLILYVTVSIKLINR